MAYFIDKEGYLDFSSCVSDEEKIDQCWDYFQNNLADAEITAFDGKRVRGFTRFSFEHIISGSSNKYDTALEHDIDFVEKRAKCLPLIKEVITGRLPSQTYRVSVRRSGKQSVRRILTVLEIAHQYYVVVLDEVRDQYRIRTAFPSNEQYYRQRIRGQGTNAGKWDATSTSS